MDMYGNTALTTNGTDTSYHLSIGTPNFYTCWEDAGDALPRSASIAFIPPEQLALELTVDFWIESRTHAQSPLIGLFSGSDLSAPTSGNLRVAGANFASLADQTPYKVHLYYNGTPTSITIYNPVTDVYQFLEAYQSAAFAHNVVTDSWTDITMDSINNQGTIERVGLCNNPDFRVRSHIWFDNLTVRAIPESYESGLFVGTSTRTWVLFRRKRRQA